jgi:hypothetical protein
MVHARLKVWHDTVRLYPAGYTLTARLDTLRAIDLIRDLREA